MSTTTVRNGLLKLIADRLELASALHNPGYEIRAVCWRCAKHLSTLEVLNGFGAEPADTTVACTKCDARVQPKLQETFRGGGKGEMPFFSKAETLRRLAGNEHLSPDAFLKTHPSAYRSAIIHFGGLRPAFKKLGLSYEGESVAGWEGKVEGFLGWMPPAMIAMMANTTITAVETLRSTKGITYQSSTALLKDWQSSRNEVVATPDGKVRMTQRLDRVSWDEGSGSEPSRLDTVQHPVSKQTHEGLGVAGCLVAKVAPTLGA